MFVRSVCMLAVMAMCVSVSRADQIIFKNGDKLTGKITTMDGGKLKIATAVAGEVVVDMKDVATFSTDAPLDIRTADSKQINAPAATAETDQIKAGEVTLALNDIAKINPPPEVWSGALVVSGQIVRGNSNTDDLGVAIESGLRRNNASNNDRTTLAGAYNLSLQKSPVTGDKQATTDNWFASGKYDWFVDKKAYVYGLFRVDHDRIANLHYRASPGVGVGYQWVETPEFAFNTEAGLSYVYEDYIVGGTEDNISFRLAYHLTKKFNDTFSGFHNLEIVPAFEDPGDYNMITDAGIRAAFTPSMFVEFKAEWKRDTSPAAGARENDLRYVLGVGWKF